MTKFAAICNFVALGLLGPPGVFRGTVESSELMFSLSSRCFFAAPEIPCAAVSLSYRQETIALCFLLV